MMSRVRKLWGNTDGAVAPIVALSLTGLIAAGGIAFDYARLASMHTELQDAADQAALAAAGQLDGQANACDRARAAAAALVTNNTLIANDSSTRAITVTQGTGCTSDDHIQFYQTYNQATDTPGLPASSDANAKVVIVTVDPRKTFYTLTPVVAAFDTGDVVGTAVASLSSAICKTPPVMLCNPDEPANNGDLNLQYNPARGIGLRLITGDASAPGNFGWLQAYDGDGNPITGANNLKEELGYNTPLGNCQPIDLVNTKTGMDTTVIDAFNTRFDVYANGNPCPGGGTCSPSVDTRKDLVCAPNASGNACKNNSQWAEASNPYHPTSTLPLSVSGGPYPSTMGYPMDLCHAVKRQANTCGIEGNGNWDRDAYFKVNYGWDHATWMAELGVPPGQESKVARYDVYKWEQSHQNVGGVGMGVPKIISGSEAAFSYPVKVTPGVATPDRRAITVAVLNCHAMNLHGQQNNVPVASWLSVFLVQPAWQRGPNQPSKIFTDQKDIYVEVIRRADVGQANSLEVRRDVPYLLK